MSKKINKRINYVQTALKQDVKNQPNRSLKDFSELGYLFQPDLSKNTSWVFTRNNSENKT